MKRRLLLLAIVAGCGGNPPPQPAEIAECLVKMNLELAGASSCEAIVKAITTVVSQDKKCSELLLHGLKCTTAGKDGG